MPDNCPRRAFFAALPQLPEAVVRTLHERSDGGRCLLSIDGRIYDATHFAADHPGGWENMIQHSGSDATKMFDVFAHSRHAHELMFTRLLRFDAVQYVGRAGAPRFARGPSRLAGRAALQHDAVRFAHDAWAASSAKAAELRASLKALKAHLSSSARGSAVGRAVDVLGEMVLGAAWRAGVG